MLKISGQYIIEKLGKRESWSHKCAKDYTRDQIFGQAEAFESSRLDTFYAYAHFATMSAEDVIGGRE